MDSYVYNALIGGAFPLFLIYYGANRLLKGKYRESAPYRLGLRFAEFGKPSKGSIWIHALSVGETMAAIPLVKAIKETRPVDTIVFSTSTETGQKTAQKNLRDYVSRFFYMPHDFSWAIRKVVSTLSPRIFLTIETDAWPNLLTFLRLNGIPAFLVNGRISPKSLKRFLMVQNFSKRLFQSFEMCMVQSSNDAGKLVKLGLDAGKVRNTGNLKFDMLPSVSAEEKESLARELGLKRDDKVWVAGSTHGGEEEIIIDVFRFMETRIPGLKLVLVPRHPDRAARVKDMVVKKGLNCSLRSTNKGFGTTAKVLVVDTLGELARLYSLAIVAFIGGSLVPVGGHNPLEALAFGVPVVFGKYMFNFKEIEELLLDANCALKVTDKKNMAAAMIDLFEEPDRLKQMGSNAQRVILQNRGATKRVIETITPYLR